MEKFVCEEHGKQMTYLCLSPHCEHTGPICPDKSCVQKHCHKLELQLTPLQKLVAELIQRKESSREKIIELRGRIAGFLEVLQTRMAVLMAEEERALVICEKVFLQLEELTPDMVEGVQLAKAGRWAEIPKPVLNKLFELFNSAMNKTKQEAQIQELEKEIGKRLDTAKDFGRHLQDSKELARLFQINVFDSKKKGTVLRFDGESSSWSFNAGKVDAIEFAVSEPQRLAGYSHFGVTDWSAGSPLTVKCAVFRQDKLLAEQEFKILKEEVESRNFELIFAAPVELEPGFLYDIVQTNVGHNFQGKQGNAGKEKSGVFTFSKSRKDNNGTSTTSGQFRGLIVHSHI